MMSSVSQCSLPHSISLSHMYIYMPRTNLPIQSLSDLGSNDPFVWSSASRLTLNFSPLIVFLIIICHVCVVMINLVLILLHDRFTGGQNLSDRLPSAERRVFIIRVRTVTSQNVGGVGFVFHLPTVHHVHSNKILSPRLAILRLQMMHHKKSVSSTAIPRLVKLMNTVHLIAPYSSASTGRGYSF